MKNPEEIAKYLIGLCEKCAIAAEEASKHHQKKALEFVKLRKELIDILKSKDWEKLKEITQVF